MINISARLILFSFVYFAFALPAPAQSTSAVVPAAATRSDPVEQPLEWHDVTTWGVEGRAWEGLERKRWFDRLPAEADGKVTPAVWDLSRDSAGMLVRFKTDASAIWADYVLFRDKLNGTNMTPIGASGLDLYARDQAGQWRWAGVTLPEQKSIRQEVVAGLAPGFREYAIYLPLRNGVENFSIGVPAGTRFEPVAPRSERPIVFYGTSITHGVSASRPGMAHPAILGRRLDRPVVNLGFSGNGRMDAAVGDLLIRIDAAVYVIDCVPNMTPATVREKCMPLVRQLRAARPTTPILLVEDRRNANAWILPKRNEFHTDNHAALHECFEKLKAEGVNGLFYLTGDVLLGQDGEATTDGSHPSDLGFVRQADAFEPVLRAALGEH